VTDALERKLYIIRRRAANAIKSLKLKHGQEFYVPSFSARTVNYKGLLLADQVGLLPRSSGQAHGFRTCAGAPALFDQYLPDLGSGASVPLHRPQWRNQHRARQRQLVQGARAGHFLADPRRRPEKVWPLHYPGQSDSASFDNALELLVMGGYSMAHAVMLMIPEAWEKHTQMDENRRAFYEYHAAMMEPWDGPAAVAFTDGRQIGATLDRNGLRPAAIWSPMTTSWSWLPNPACCRFRKRRSSRNGACNRARCS
jgi:glutamate synthase (NADPH/NADH) large chain